MKGLKENFRKVHILVIGSGIIGKFNALELSELGFRITIIDPARHKNSSNAALGLLMGNMYQKRRGRSWNLRKQSMELWPQWIEFLREFNYENKNKVSDLLNPINFFIWLVVSFKDIF